MPKRAAEKTAGQVRQLKRPGLHAVGGVAGLVLQVNDNGARSWILRTTIGGKRRSLGLGAFPEVGLADAREDAKTIKRRIRDEGIDPVAERKARQRTLAAAAAAQITFAECARECHKVRAAEFRNEKHRKDWLSALERFAFPVLGNLTVGEIELAHVSKVLKPIWDEKTETATRVRQRMETVLEWARVQGYRTGENPAAWKGNLEHTLSKPSKITRVNHYKALPWMEAGAFMEKLRQREGLAARALEFAILTAARSGEVRKATWDEIDLQARVWTVPADRIKAGKAHKVPLSDDALALLQALPRMQDSPYLFPAAKGGPLSDMALTAVLRRMKVDATVHGFRSTFKDWARNRTSYADEVSELALAHVNSDATRAAYARDELLPKRKRLMADWARWCADPEPQMGEVHSIGEAQ